MSKEMVPRWRSLERQQECVTHGWVQDEVELGRNMGAKKEQFETIDN